MKMLVDVAQKNIRSVTDKLHLFQKMKNYWDVCR